MTLGSSLAASAMTMRAEVRRNGAALDGYGAASGPGDWQVVSAAEACFVWVRARRLVADGSKVVTVEEIAAILRADSEIAQDDQLEITDRRGRTLFGGTLVVETIVEKYGAGVLSHKEATLRRVHG